MANKGAGSASKGMKFRFPKTGIGSLAMTTNVSENPSFKAVVRAPSVSLPKARVGISRTSPTRVGAVRVQKFADGGEADSDNSDNSDNGGWGDGTSGADLGGISEAMGNYADSHGFGDSGGMNGGGYGGDPYSSGSGTSWGGYENGQALFNGMDPDVRSALDSQNYSSPGGGGMFGMGLDATAAPSPLDGILGSYGAFTPTMQGVQATQFNGQPIQGQQPPSSMNIPMATPSALRDYTQPAAMTAQLPDVPSMLGNRTAYSDFDVRNPMQGGYNLSLTNKDVQNGARMVGAESGTIISDMMDKYGLSKVEASQLVAPTVMDAIMGRMVSNQQPMSQVLTEPNQFTPMNGKKSLNQLGLDPEIEQGVRNYLTAATQTGPAFPDLTNYVNENIAKPSWSKSMENLGTIGFGQQQHTLGSLADVPDYHVSMANPSPSVPDLPVSLAGVMADSVQKQGTALAASGLPQTAPTPPERPVDQPNIGAYDFGQGLNTTPPQGLRDYSQDYTPGGYSFASKDPAYSQPEMNNGFHAGTGEVPGTPDFGAPSLESQLAQIDQDRQAFNEQRGVNMADGYARQMADSVNQDDIAASINSMFQGPAQPTAQPVAATGQFNPPQQQPQQQSQLPGVGPAVSVGAPPHVASMPQINPQEYPTTYQTQQPSKAMGPEWLGTALKYGTNIGVGMIPGIGQLNTASGLLGGLLTGKGLFNGPTIGGLVQDVYNGKIAQGQPQGTPMGDFGFGEGYGYSMPTAQPQQQQDPNSIAQNQGSLTGNHVAPVAFNSDMFYGPNYDAYMARLRGG